MPFPLIVAGHTHINAFAPPPDQPATPIFVGDGDLRVLHGPSERDDDYWTAFAKAEPGAAHAVVWRGDQHVRALLVEPVPPLDFVLSAAPDLPLDPRASYVAEAQLRAVFAPSLVQLAGVLQRVRAEAPSSPLLVSGTPPPIGDIDAVAARMSRDPQFATLLTPDEKGVAPVITLTSPYTLQKIWSLVQLMLGEIAMRNDAVFVPVPDRTRTLEGFLAPAYWAEDPIHANAAFARELAVDLREVVTSRQEQNA